MSELGVAKKPTEYAPANFQASLKDPTYFTLKKAVAAPCTGYNFAIGSHVVLPDKY